MISVSVLVIESRPRIDDIFVRISHCWPIIVVLHTSCPLVRQILLHVLFFFLHVLTATH